MAHAIGEETLRRINAMPRFNQWMFDNIAPYLGKRVIEVGCGIGNFTELMIDDRNLLALDIEEDYIGLLKKRWNGSSKLKTALADLSVSSPQEVVDFKGDTVVCLNVLEHVKDDTKMLRNMLNVLAPGGRLVLLVPAFQSLYGTLDVGLGHYRRYSRTGLESLMRSCGFEIERTFYMNLFGMFGWWFSGKVLKRDILPKNALNMYHLLTPVFRFVEKVTGPPFGQSVICIGRKPL